MAIEGLKVKYSFYLEVCNMLYQPLGLLTDGTKYSAYDIELSRTDNDADKLIFSISEKSPKFKYLVNENMVLMDGEYYLIKKISLEDGEDYSYRFECEHEMCSYKEKLNGKIDMIGESPEALINEVCTNVTSPLPICFGGTDIVGKYRHLISDEQSVFANLVSIAEVFGARLVFKKINGVIHIWLLANPKDKGRFVEKKRDLDSVNLEYDSNEMFTRLHYFGASDEDTGNEITMHDANPTGKSYIEDFSYYINQGYSLEDIKSNPNCIREMTISNPDLTTPQQIYEMALQEIEKICRPKMTASINIIDLQQIKGYILEPIEIGDLIRVYDRTRNLHLEATVVGINKRSEDSLDIGITLSNVIEINSALKDLVNSSQTIDKITNGGNVIQGVFVSVGAKNLKVELFEHITKITGNTTQINDNKSSIEANTKEIALKVSESEYKKDQTSINDRITQSEIKLEPDNISATVTQNKTFTDIIDGAKVEMDAEATKKLNEYKGTVDKEFSDVNTVITDTKTYIDGAFKDGILTEAEKEGLKVQINQIKVEEKDVEKKYTEVYHHSLLINKATLKQAYDQYIATGNDLIAFLESLLLLTNIEIGHVQEKDRLFRLYEEYLGNVQAKITMALDEIALNRTNNLQSSVEEKFATLDIDLDGINLAVGKNTETITENKTIAENQANNAQENAINHTNTEIKKTNDKVAAIDIKADNINQSVSSLSEQVVTIDGEVKGKITLEQAKAEIDIKANEITQSVASSGGGNLLVNTSFVSGLIEWYSCAYDWPHHYENKVLTPDSPWCPDGGNCFQTRSDVTTATGGGFGIRQRVKISKKGTYTFSCYTASHRCSSYFYIRGAQTGTNYANHQVNNGKTGGKNITDWVKVIKTFTIHGEDNEVWIEFYANNVTSGNPHAWMYQPMLNEGNIATAWIEKSPSSTYVEQQLSTTSITNKVSSGLTSGTNITGTATELTKDYFRVRNLGNNSRVDIQSGKIFTYNAQGAKSLELQDSALIFYDFINQSKSIGWVSPTYVSSKNQWYISMYTSLNGGNEVQLGHENSAGIVTPAISTKRNIGIDIYDVFDSRGFNMKIGNVNQHDVQKPMLIDNLYIKSNSISGSILNGWMWLNTWNSNIVAVGRGNNDGKYGILRCGELQQIKGTELASQNPHIASYSAQSVHETISDIGHSVIGNNGEAIIFFDNEFLDFADTKTSYFISYEVVGRNSKQVQTYEKNDKYFIVGGEVGQEFSYKVECKKAGSNCTRYYRDLAQPADVQSTVLDNVESLASENRENKKNDALKDLETFRDVRKLESFKHEKELKEENKAMNVALELAELKKQEELENE